MLNAQNLLHFSPNSMPSDARHFKAGGDRRYLVDSHETLADAILQLLVVFVCLLQTLLHSTSVLFMSALFES